jgi:hypothetical protein
MGNEGNRWGLSSKGWSPEPSKQSAPGEARQEKRPEQNIGRTLRKALSLICTIVLFVYLVAASWIGNHSIRHRYYSYNRPSEFKQTLLWMYSIVIGTMEMIHMTEALTERHAQKNHCLDGAARSGPAGAEKNSDCPCPSNNQEGQTRCGPRAP